MDCRVLVVGLQNPQIELISLPTMACHTRSFGGTGCYSKTKEEQELYEKGLKLQTKERREARLRERREIQLAEHIVGYAIWLNENEFAERF